MGNDVRSGIQRNHVVQAACVIVMSVTEDHCVETFEVDPQDMAVMGQCGALSRVEENSRSGTFYERREAVLCHETQSRDRVVIDHDADKRCRPIVSQRNSFPAGTEATYEDHTGSGLCRENRNSSQFF